MLLHRCCAESAARTAAEEAQLLAAEAQSTADARAADLRVAQDSLKGMREECNERWVSGLIIGHLQTQQFWDAAVR